MKRLLLAVATGAAVLTAACSGGGSSVQPPPPMGKYSNSSLNGTYAFVTNGAVINSGGESPLARVGSFTANGAGAITVGMEDVNAAGNVTLASQITGGSYTVNADGHGTLTLNVAGSSINFGIVLTSTSGGLLIDETANANQLSTGSGNFILQQSTPFALSEISGTYVFDFSGMDTAGNPESLLGEFTANGAGTIPTGFFDENDAELLTNGPMTQGSVFQDPAQPATFTSFGRGLAIINGQDFVFYIVNSNQMRFVSANNGMLSGDAIVQSANVPTSTGGFNGSFVFILSGSSNTGGITKVGRFTANGASVSNVLADVDDTGEQHPSSTLSNGTVSFDPANPGRGTITFSDNSFPFTFVFYLSSPTSGVVQDVTGSNGVGIVIADGSLAAQSAGPFTSSNITGTYALNWSGLATNGSSGVVDEEDLVAQTTITNLSLSGTADLYQFSASAPAPLLNLGVGGTIGINGDGTSDDGHRSGLTVNLTGASSITFVIYFVSPQQAFFAINSGNTHLDAGVLQLQQ